MLKGLAIATLILALLFANCPNKGSAKQKDKSKQTPAPSVTISNNSARQNEADRSGEKAPDPHAGIEWSNWALVLVGALGVVAGLLTLRAIGKQADIANRTLIAQFRPKIIVRKVVIDPYSVEYFDRRGEGAEWKISLHLHNAGGTVAHVQKYKAWLHCCDGSSGSTRKLVGWAESDASFDIPAGGNKEIQCIPNPKEFRAMLVAIGADRELEWNTGGEIEADFFVYLGTITYTDEIGTSRNTAFHRIWRGTENQFFTASKNPDQEYSD
jgi:hypothetical protein